jgi:penicillin-binding protein 2
METAGYYPDPSDKIKKDGSRWMPGDTANLCIGQGQLQVTPLQMAVMTAAVANGGKVFEPRVVDRIEPQDADAGGEVTRFPPGQVRNELKLDPAILDIVRNAMRYDVDHKDEATGRFGTGHSAAVEGLNVCGKTGTAQTETGNREHITWFVSFAPFESPRYALAVVIEGGSSGAITCAPIAHDIYEGILKRERGTVKPQSSLVAN